MEGKIKGDGARHPRTQSAHRFSPAHGAKAHVQVKGIKSLNSRTKMWCELYSRFPLAFIRPMS